MLTWREAAITALKGAGVLNVQQVTDRIVELGLRDLTGQTPEASVGAQLYVAVQNRDQRIEQVGPGLFRHTGSESPPVTERILGKLEFINPREVWPDEARHFTPWLLDNSDYLAEALGVDIEFERSEHPVGSFSLDLFGRDVSNEVPIIVENQLEQTDHRHLGQLLTYAAGTKAGTIVWIAPSFRDEHRDALDFLNDSSSGNVRFFGVKLRVAVIGDSDPAPDFELVAQPSNWIAQVRSQTGKQRPSDGLSDVRLAQLSFWSRYLDVLRETHPNLTNVRKPQPQNWLTLNFNRGTGITAVFVSDGTLRCEVYISTKSAEANKRIFGALIEHREAVEESIGHTLTWDEMPGRQACRISVTTPGTPLEDQPDQLISWLIEYHVKFHQTFMPLISGLPRELWAPSGD